MDWQSMVIFSFIFALTNNAVSRGIAFLEHLRREKELDRMLDKISNIDQRIAERAVAGVRRVK